MFWIFLSTLSLRRATYSAPALSMCAGYFYPRSPCGERPRCRIAAWGAAAFLSTLSLRRATSAHRLQAAPVHNFYPRSPCGERLYRAVLQDRARRISIHALLAESDSCSAKVSFTILISIHALLAESDWNNPQVTMHTWRFLSTLSLRRATFLC